MALRKFWPVCSFDIALRNYMAGEVINIALRTKVLCYDNVFHKYNYTKNRGACV
jgi:hypothetical protein